MGRWLSGSASLSPDLLTREISYSDGEIALLAGLHVHLEESGNPLRTLWYEIYPQWLAARGPLYRLRRGDPQPMESGELLRFTTTLLGRWAFDARLRERSSLQEPARWVVLWALRAFYDGKQPPNLRYRRKPEEEGRARPPDGIEVSPPRLGTPGLGNVEPVENTGEISITVTIPRFGATRQKFLNAASRRWTQLHGWELESMPDVPLKSGSPLGGRPTNLQYFEFLALALCGLSPAAIAKKLKTKASVQALMRFRATVSTGQHRAAETANIYWPLPPLTKPAER